MCSGSYLSAEAVIPLPIACATRFHVAVEGFKSAAVMARISIRRSSSGVQVVPLPPLPGILIEACQARRSVRGFESAFIRERGCLQKDKLMGMISCCLKRDQSEGNKKIQRIQSC